MNLSLYRRHLPTAALLCAFSVTASSAFSQTRTWDRGGGTSGWSLFTNWSSNTEPGTANPVVFPSTVPGSAPVIDLAILEGASTLQFDNSYTLQGGDLTLGAGTITAAAGTSSTISSVVKGSAGVTKTGTGTLTLAGANTYTGGTIVSQGTLILGNTTAASSGTITLGDASSGSNAITLLANDIAVANNITVSSSGTGTVSIGATATNTGNSLPDFTGTFTLNRATTLLANELDRFNVGGVITGNVGLLTIDGGSRVSFTGSANTFTGDVRVQGNSILQIGVSTPGSMNKIPDNSSVTVDSGSTFQLSTGAETINGLNGGGLVKSFFSPSSAPLLTVGAGNADASFSGVIALALGLTKTGSGTQELSGVNTYTGATTVSGGTLLMGASNTLSNSSAMVLAGGKLETAGYSDTTGALSMTSSSVIDLGTGSSTVSFASLGALTGTLSIWNWSGTPWNTGGTDQLLFAAGTPGAYSNVQFYKDFGTTLIGPGRLVALGGGGYELIAVPEPTALAGVLILAASTTRRRRKVRAGGDA